MNQLSESQRWLEMREDRALKAKSTDLRVRLEAARFDFNQPMPPEWYRRELEYQRRRGFREGYETAIQHLLELNRKGYGRPREIGNILGRFLNELRAWMQRAFTDEPGGWGKRDIPPLVQPTWAELREQVFARDGHKCMLCDSPDDLEAHHVHPVCEGGLPELKNLTTHCRTCHRLTPVPEEPDNLSEAEAASLLYSAGVITGIPWSWCDCEPSYCGGRWQLMPARSEDEGDFWWWHITHRRQFFTNRRTALDSLLKSFARWASLPEKGRP